ncbi:serine protein kinase RIO [Candidatus Woesearchaeota archaeon]|nr:serine protein kinase RIO [Candidatus Woesearchaeota archaeon]
MPKISKEGWKIYKNVFDEFTIKTIFKLITQGYFEGLTSPCKIGKESNVFLAKKNNEQLIVKIYRLESCNFNKMYDYIKSDPRYSKLKKQRRKVIFSWVQREYRNLLKAREAINVPTPYTFINNVLVMEMIGDDEPALQLKDLIPENLESFFNKTLDAVKKLYKTGIVHADLSEFNILNYNEKPYFIDFSQGTSVKDQRAEELMERDIWNLCRFFRRYGLELNTEEILKKIKS